jgi:hypothetical protein
LELLSEPLAPDEFDDPWPASNEDRRLFTIYTFLGSGTDWESDGEGLWHNLGFAAFTYPMGVKKVAVPFWFVTLVAVVGGLIPWIRWSKRFSLRTLLIATTLVAVVLGLIGYAMR